MASERKLLKNYKGRTNYPDTKRKKKEIDFSERNKDLISRFLGHKLKIIKQ